MIIYLDQNKWIELAKAVYGKDRSDRAAKIKQEFKAAINSGAIFPLSAIHYIELSRISNDARRARLGKIMWDFSRGHTMASYKELIRQEVEIGLSAIFPHIVPRHIEIISRGSEHAFGEKYLHGIPEAFNDIFESSLLAGNVTLNISPVKAYQSEQRAKFLTHLSSLHERKDQLEKSKWENWLYAMTIVDMLEPLHDVCQTHGISVDAFSEFGQEHYKIIVDRMPTRRLDIHLHRQILKNPEYKPKLNDLEDWSGVGVASCYCDVVVCEKHFADLLKRDHYVPYARIETDLSKIFKEISHDF